jgi:3-oxoadipate enol-lactonase
MDIAKVAGVELEYEVVGTGEPVLLIGPVVAGGFRPFLSEPPLLERFRLIHYHRRGWAGSTQTSDRASIADHAADAAGLLAALGVQSIGAVIALDLALSRRDVVHTLGLLEPSALFVPAAQGFFQAATPSLDAYGGGYKARAVAEFLTLVSGLGWERCRAIMEEHAPGALAQTIDDADTLFGAELPALMAWTLTREQAAALDRPTLSLRGSDTGPLWIEVAELLRGWLPDVDERIVDGVGHLLQLQRPEPVALALAEFLARHPIRARARRSDRSAAPV